MASLTKSRGFWAVLALILLASGYTFYRVYLIKDVAVPPPQPSIKAETLFTLGPLHFTNSMLMTLLVIVLLVAFFAWATRRMALVPGGGQNLAEAVVEALLSLVEGSAGKRVGRVIFPLIATLFIFILAANYLALLPGVGSIGTCERVAAAEGAGATTEAPSIACPAGTRFVPFLRAPNADLNTTVAMALIAFTVVQVTGVVAHGVGGYLKEFVSPPLLAPIHIVGELARIISLSCRLFGNILGGEVLLLVMYYLLGSILVSFGVFIFLGLEVLFGGIQALLFSLLSLTYIAMAAAGHGGAHDEEAKHDPAAAAHAGPAH